jgi:peptide/nickel transport system ATP-binding protein
MSLLRIENLAVTIDTIEGQATIIDDISFSMNKGEKLGIVGESGCGKSITALAIMSLLPKGAKLSGNIELDGKELVSLSQKKYDQIRGNQIGMIFQEPMTALNPVMTIGKQISESLILHKKLSRKEAKEKTTILMEDVGMPTSRFPLDLYPHQLSGGQRQRIMIAAAIACEPDILIADEPTTALDVTVQEQILELIVELADKSDMGLIMISHDLGVIAQSTDRTLIMYSGRLIETGTTTDVFEQMSHPYTFGLFSAIPKVGRSIHEKRLRLDSIPGHVPEIHNRPIGCDFGDRCSRAIPECYKAKPGVKTLASDHEIRCFNPRPEKGTA